MDQLVRGEPVAQGSVTDGRRGALVTLCLGTLMIVLDATIVNVALASIGAALHFSETSLVWVVNAYTLMLGGCLLLSGRLGDLLGHRNVFLTGIAIFTLASLACGVATSQWVLIGARGMQGIGGAIVSSVSLALISRVFPDGTGRAKAMAFYSFVRAGGGSLGVLLGGVLTSGLGWRWIFLVNLPIGMLVWMLCLHFVPRARAPDDVKHLDVGGAVTVASASMIAVYVIVQNQVLSTRQSIELLSISAVLLIAFIAIERRAPHPLVPLRLFRSRAIIGASVVGALWAAVMYAWLFICALYLQKVLGYEPIRVAVGFLPVNIAMGALSLGLSAKIVRHFGIKVPLVAGLLLVAAGLMLLAAAPLSSTILDLCPAMILLGIGSGVAFSPLLMACVSDVAPEDSGAASGLFNTAMIIGGGVGLAILASAASTRTDHLLHDGVASVRALYAGYRLAFGAGAMVCVLASIAGMTIIPGRGYQEGLR